MEIEILQIIKNNEPTTKVKGWVHLRLQKRMEVYMTILEGKNTLFLKAPSVKIEGEYKPSYAWMNDEVMKKIHHEVTPTLKEKLLDKTPQFPF